MLKRVGKKGDSKRNLPMRGQIKGQVTIFIIIAVLIVAAVLVYLFFRGTFTVVRLPPNLQPAYTNFLSCLEQDTSVGIQVLEAQGGYIALPEFEPGSEFMPFSSQLNFLGNPIPYWYYVSGNNIPKEQVPSKGEMEAQLADYIEQKINNCNFNDFYEQGFEVSWENPSAKTTIRDNRVETTLNMNLNIARGDESAVVRSHKVTVNSDLGSLYDSAKKVYEQQQDDLFLEEYAVDILRNYAPVDGVEISCSPLIWNADDVFDDLEEAIEANTIALSNQGNRDDYFSIDISGVSEEVRFLNSRQWPHSFEVNPSDGVLLVSNPAGNQPGLGILGFCYVPYHYVYDMKYPVVVQVSSNSGEVFQFPMAVILQGNNPREALEASAVENVVPELCAYKNTEISVSVRDTSGNAIQGADIAYECFSNKCNIGQTSDSGSLTEDFPQCVNGYVVARADGFKESRYLFSTVSPGSANIVMDRLYSQNVQLNLDGTSYNGNAIIYFIPEASGSTQTISYPEQKNVQLAEGQYEINVYIYRDSEINIGATTTTQCITVPRGAILGAFGFTQERCFEIEVPEQLVSQALAGGGKQNQFILESELASPAVLEINAQSLPLPQTIEQLSDNHLLFESQGLDIVFR